MDLFFYFIICSLIFFTAANYLFFSRPRILKVLHESSHAFIVMLSSLFFCVLFGFLQLSYFFCEHYFLVEPLWKGQLIFLFLCIIIVLFIIKKLVLQPYIFFEGYHVSAIVEIRKNPFELYKNCALTLKNSGSELLLESTKPFFLIAHFCSETDEKQYIIECKIKKKMLFGSRLYITCYPFYKTNGIEKNELKTKINLFLEHLNNLPQ